MSTREDGASCAALLTLLTLVIVMAPSVCIAELCLLCLRPDLPALPALLGAGYGTQFLEILLRLMLIPGDSERG